MRVLRLALLLSKKRISEKLGVCPFCMRASALGSLASWAVYAGARWLHIERISAGSFLLALLVVVASCFTLLIVAHLVAYMVRVARDIRVSEARLVAQAAAPSTAAPDRSKLTRREFVRLVLGAGAYAATIALLGSVPSFAQPMCTDNVQPPQSDPISGRGDNDAEALEQMIDNANAFCNDWCNDKNCGVAFTCIHGGKPTIEQPKCKTLSNGQRYCTTTVKGGCNCSCKPCQGRHTPTNSIWGKEHIAEGAGISAAGAQGAMEADAKAKCAAFCAKLKCPAGPPPPKTCQRETDPQLGDRKPWHVAGDPNPFKVKARIKACQCKCL